MERASSRVEAQLQPASGAPRRGTSDLLVRLGVLAIALGVFLERVGEGVAQTLSGLGFALGLLLVGWVLGRLVREFEALGPALRSLAEALEQGGMASKVEPARNPALLAFREAIDRKDWLEAERLARSTHREAPEAPETGRLQAEWAEAKPAALNDLKGRLDAARQVQDPDQVLSYHQGLSRLLEAPARAELDREVVSWLMGLIQKRMRSGTVRADVARLASKVAEAFGNTTEGASLRAALPTLRRSAGLCPRCGEPYQGVADACPQCLAQSLAP